MYKSNGGTYMNTENMKNILILKDLPSNLVEEAIVFLKQNQKIRKPEYIENKDKFKNSENGNKNKDNFLINEAKFVISDYILKVEKENSASTTIEGTKKINKQYKKVKSINFCLIVALLISMILNFI